MAKRFRLGKPELAGELEKLSRQAKLPREVERLRAVRMAMSGDFTLGQIAQACGRSRSAVGQWMRVAREQGLAALMGLHQGRGRSSAIRGKVKNEMLKGLARGRWKRLGDIARWLRERHGVEMGIGGVGYHVGKCGGVRRVPRRTHRLKRHAEADRFKRTLARQLWALHAHGERPVRVWFMDEHRYGLIAHQRRHWGLRRCRTHAPYRTRYEWGYLATALEAGGKGRAVQVFFGGVSQETTAVFYAQVRAVEPEAHHIIIADQAGFHLPPGHPQLPEGIRVLPLPAYSPELNPAEHVGSMLKMATANRVFETLPEMEAAIEQEMRPLWNTPARVHSLIGDNAVHSQTNVTSKKLTSGFQLELVSVLRLGVSGY
jgi:transposase